jgi:hypothetical protein
LTTTPYTDPTVWENFDPKCITPNSLDPQAIRPPDEPANVVMVTLPTNFKVAKFDDDKSTDSIFVPLVKRAMLLAGNYRCITEDGVRIAQEAVHSDLETSRAVYEFVNDLCVKLGASPSDLLPFEKYAAAAQSLVRPASAARAQQWSALYRTSRYVGATDCQAEGLESPGDRRNCDAGKRATRCQSQEGGVKGRLARAKDSSGP